MDQVSARIAASAPALEDHVPLRKALERFGETTLRAVQSERAVMLLRLCLGEHGRFPELSTAVWSHGPAVTYARFRAFLEARTRRGELAVDDSQLAAEHFLGGIVGHTARRSRDRAAGRGRGGDLPGAVRAPVAPVAARGFVSDLEPLRGLCAGAETVARGPR